MISPTYSMMRSPSGMFWSANTPLPCTPDRRTWILRLDLVAGETGIGKFSVNLNSYTCAHAYAYVYTREQSADCKNIPDEQDTSHRREAFRRPGHRPGADARGRQIREA